MISIKIEHGPNKRLTNNNSNNSSNTNNNIYNHNNNNNDKYPLIVHDMASGQLKEFR